MKTHNSQLKTHNRRQPLVSVIMPVYNAGAFLVEAIESILQQTYRNFELIIVDDASTDNSWNIISDYKNSYPKRIKVFHITKQTNSAGNGATNYGLRFAKGEFIARMDADDIAEPTRLEKQVKYLLKHPQTILLGTQATIINEFAQPVGTKQVPTNHKEIYQHYGIVHPIIHPSAMIRRSLLPDPKRLYEDKFGVSDDYYTFFRLLNFGKFANLPLKLLRYRIHGKNASLTDLRAKCVNTVKIRLAAIKDFGYKMSLTGFLSMSIQSVLAVILPETALRYLYLKIRKLVTIKKYTESRSLYPQADKRYTEVSI